jgi:3'(2'), 5'-bisphosphate nucleotidase
MIDLTSPEISFALDTTRQASLLAKRVQAEMVSPALTKDDHSPVTVADFAVQAAAAFHLAQVFPDDPLVAEEDAAELRPMLAETQAGRSSLLSQVTHFAAQVVPGAQADRVCDWIDRGGASTSQRFWTLDPIDGTKGFLRGDQYAIALALLADGQVQVGVLGCPNLELVAGARGAGSLVPKVGGAGALVIAALRQGTWATPLDGSGEFIQLRAAGTDDPTRARLLRSFESGHTNVDQIDVFARRLGIQAKPVRMDSQAKYAVLASGGGELILRLLSPSKPDYREKIWDQAAGALIVQEAGGEISDLAGRALDFSTGRSLARNRGILASNAMLHGAALQALGEIGA